MNVLLRRILFAAMTSAALAGCAKPKPTPAASPATDPRNNLKAGLFDAAEYTSNMKVLARAQSPQGFLGITNSDLAFTGHYVIQGNYNGPVVWDISNPASPKLVVAYECPASQNDVSVYKHLMFLSAEAQNGRVDCKPGGVRETVSKERMRGVRIFDISNIREPKLLANVQTCRGSHTHTVLEDPKDTQNVYIYVSGSSGIRPADELAGCAGNTASSDAGSSRLRIEIIKVPLADPSKAAVVSRANIFAGLNAPSTHGASDADKAEIDAIKARGAFMFMIPAMNQEIEVPAQFVKPVLDSITKARGASTPNAADTAAARPVVNAVLTRLLAAQGMMSPPEKGAQFRRHLSVTTLRSIRPWAWPVAPARAMDCCSTSAIRWRRSGSMPWPIRISPTGTPPRSATMARRSSSPTSGAAAVRPSAVSGISLNGAPTRSSRSRTGRWCSRATTRSRRTRRRTRTAWRTTAR